MASSYTLWIASLWDSALLTFQTIKKTETQSFKFRSF